MNDQYHHDLSSMGAPALSAANTAALDHFEGTLNKCVASWQHGDHIVMLPDNIRECYGDMAVHFLQRILIDEVGEPVDFTIVDDPHRPKTFVQMPKPNKPQQPMEAQTVTSQQEEESNSIAANTDVAPVCAKKAPRPMNCWIIFRDVMHKKLKAENPDYTVQEICKQFQLLQLLGIRSSDFVIAIRCSEIWRELTPAQKKPWQAAAKAAKEEHLRLHPDYKYSPRKPGEKKKRQSRKAKQAANVMNGTATLDFALVPEIAMTANETNSTFTNTTEIDFNNFDNDFANNVSDFMDPASFMTIEPQGYLLEDQVHNTESVRHDRLQAEMDTELGVNLSYDIFNDEAFAFRAGADGNATLPSIYSDSY